MATTSDRLVQGIKRRLSLPSNQALLQTSDMLAVADDMIKSRMIPLVEALDQDYFIRDEEVPLVSGQSEYAIPYRSIGRKLRELHIRDGGNIRNLSLIALEDAHLYSTSALTVGFYFKGDRVRVVPDVPTSISSSQSLLFWFYMPPSNLVSVADAALVTDVSASPVITCSSVPTAVSGATSIDFVQGQSGNSIWDYDVAFTGTTATTITFASVDDVPSDLAAGDYISAAQTSPVINFLPNELIPLLETYSAQRIGQEIGDFEGMKMITETDVSTEEQNARRLLAPRIKGEPTVIINRYSLTRGMKFAQRRWIYGT